jgi:hypothetical protein
MLSLEVFPVFFFQKMVVLSDELSGKKAVFGIFREAVHSTKNLLLFIKVNGYGI